MTKSGERLRECIVTRQSLPASALIRFALSPDGVLAPDIDARAPGRGVWVTASQSMVAEAASRNIFAKALKEKVGLPDDLAGLTRQHLETRLLGALGLARKAGQLVLGAGKVESALRSGKAVALITASDAAPDSRRKMLQALRASPAPEIQHIDAFASARLGLALGSENVIHAALTAGAAAQTAIGKYRRFLNYIAPARAEQNELA